ncbi:hypothetical protein REPUB_Repub17cG0001500 [Reevesia pubescens]
MQVLGKLEAATKPLRKSFVKHGLSNHTDKDVKLLVAICVAEFFSLIEQQQQLIISWVTLTSGTLTSKPTALVLKPTVCVKTPMPSLGSMDLSAADSVFVATPRKSDSSSTTEEFIWCEVGRTLSKNEPL